MLTKRMQDELNKQINRELFSAYLYMALSAHFENENLKGFAHWMLGQSQEELVHAKKIYDYVFDRGGRVHLEAIEKPQKEWPSLVAAMEEAYNHEVEVSEDIGNLVRISMEENDYSTHTFLQWFVNEQIEEEATADEKLQKLKLVGDDRSGLFMLDHELSQRSLPANSAPA